MVAVNVGSFQIETTTRQGDVVRADVYLPAGRDGPVLLGTSPYQKALRRLAVATSAFPHLNGTSTNRNST